MNRGLCFLILCLGLFFLYACKGKKDDPHYYVDEEVQIDYDVNQALNELVTIWNDAHNIQDSVLFTSLFGEWVSYYGEDLSMKTCIHRKMNFFRDHPDFKQEIKEGIRIKPLPAGNYRCDFQKDIFYGGKEYNYQAYLIYLHFEDRFRIIKESDFNTDQFFRSLREN